MGGTRFTWLGGDELRDIFCDLFDFCWIEEAYLGRPMVFTIHYSSIML